MAKQPKPKVTVKPNFNAPAGQRWQVYVGSQLHSAHHDSPSANYTAKDLRRHG